MPGLDFGGIRINITIATATMIKIQINDFIFTSLQLDPKCHPIQVT